MHIFIKSPFADSHIISTVTEPKVLNDAKHMKMPLCHNLSYVNSQGLDQLVPATQLDSRHTTKALTLGIQQKH